MKRLTWSAFVAFWTCTLTIVALGALAPAPAGALADEAEPVRQVTLAELAQHASEGDCWMAIRGNVYDFSDYIPQHPTPPVVMTPWCGQDATEAYRTKGYGRPHSAMADALLDQYLIGVLVTD